MSADGAMFDGFDFHELVVDSFAGGGGASTGIFMALGRHPDVAVNHDGEALAMHEANHPSTEHIREDVWAVDPEKAMGYRQVGLLWASPDCFPAGTMILTDRGYRPIEAIVEGDRVLTHAGRYRRVYATMRTARPVRCLEIQGLPSVRVSSEHPFYARAMANVWDNQHRRYARTLSAPAWVKASDLRSGSAPMNAAGGDRHFCASPCQFEQLPIPAVGGRGITLDERLMWLAGRYVGDGWSRLSQDRAELVITCGRTEADELAGPLGLWPRRGKRSGADELAWHRRDTATAHQFSTGHRGLVEWLRDEFGHGGENKSFPAWAFSAPEPIRRALLAGYVSADGSTIERTAGAMTETVTISKALALSTKALAESLGFTATVSQPRRNSSVIEGRTVNAKPVYMVRWRENPQRLQTVREGLHNWSRVQSVGPEGGVVDLFNLSVEEDETYIADGLVAHNCKHFSKAKGGKPVSKKIRGLAWVVTKWAAKVRPRVISMENVEEFKTWGPLIQRDGEWHPDPARKGEYFARFLARFRKLGYTVEHRELRACDYGAPTIRKRLFLIMRRDGLPIVWPAATHGDPKSLPVQAGKLKPWRTAAECIDWTLPCPSIFERKKPLADATMKRIAKGIQRYVIDAAEPFIVNLTHQGSDRIESLDEPLRTVTGAKRGEKALVVASIASFTQNGQGQQPGAPLSTVMAGAPKFGLVETQLAPFITEHANASNQRNMPADEPLRTQMAQVKGGHFAAVTAFMTKFRTNSIGSDMAEPVHTLTAGGETARPSTGNVMGLVTSHLAVLRNNVDATSMADPLNTVSAGGQHHAEVRAFLIAYYGNEQEGQGLTDPLRTMPTKDRFGLVTIKGVDYQIVDIGMRMLTPRELANAQGFPADYIIDHGADGKPLTKTAQVRMIGNSVCPPVAAAIVRANFQHEQATAVRKGN